MFKKIQVVFGLIAIAVAACSPRPSSPVDVVATPPASISTYPVQVHPEPIRVTPQSDQPAAGICASVPGDWVVFEIFPDIPDPRCAIGGPNQRLKLVNRTDTEVTLGIGSFILTLAPGQEQVIDAPLQDYLLPGVHRISTSQYYGGSGPELWFMDAGLSPTQPVEWSTTQQPTPSPSALVYFNTANGFSLTVPAGTEVPASDSADGWIGQQVFFSVRDTDPAACYGECPVIQKSETGLTVAGHSASRLSGYFGAIGGYIPQQYRTYVFPREGRYYVFTLFALDRDDTNRSVGTVWPLEPGDVEAFDRMISTLAFVPVNSATAAAEPNGLALVNGTLIDGTGTGPLPNAVVLIENGFITMVGARAEVAIPEGMRLIDLQGATILPGFINAHVHGAFNAENLKAWAAAGVTTVRDEGILTGENLDEMIQLRENDLNGPEYARLISAGKIMTVPNGYGALYVSSPEEARRAVFDELDAGADLIKLSEEDGYAGRSGLPRLTFEELQAIVAAAHERGMLVSAHITQAQYMEMVVKAGVDDIAHMAYDPISEALIREIVEKGITVVPTFTVLKSYDAIGASVDNLRSLVEAGAKVALGNDYVPGRDLFELGMPMYEIEMMQQAGMTPMQIIVSATKNAAAVCNRPDLGTLEPGKVADLLIVEADPLKDLNALTAVRMVIKNGVIIR